MIDHSSSVNSKGTSHTDPLSRILSELSSLKLWKEKQERKEKGKKEWKIDLELKSLKEIIEKLVV